MIVPIKAPTEADAEVDERSAMVAYLAISRSYLGRDEPLDSAVSTAGETWHKLNGDLVEAERDAGHAAQVLTTTLAEQDSAFRKVGA